MKGNDFTFVTET